MNFRFLQAFHWIVRLGSFAAAAERLNMTQSTISARVRELELTLGVTLFNRNQRAVTLTAAGRALVPLAEEALALQALIKTSVGQKAAISGLVKIGVGEIVAMSWFPSLLARLNDIYPAVEVELVVDLTVNLNRMLAAGQIDIAFVVAPASTSLTSHRLGATPMRWIANPALAANAEITPAYIADNPIFTLSRDSHLYDHVVTWLRKHKLKPRVIHGCNSVSAMIAMTKKGYGAAILPTVLVEGELSRGELVMLDIESAIDNYEFFIVRDALATDPAILAIEELALEVSTFDKLET